MFTPLALRLRLAARSAALGLVGGLLILVGIAFLTVSAWFGLTLVTTKAIAALIIGGAYFGVGLIILAIASARPRYVPPPPPPITSTTLVAAFFEGLQAGKGARRDKSQ